MYLLLLLFFLAASSLCCCAQAFSSCSEHCSVRACHCGGFSCCWAQALGTRTSVVATRGLGSCGSWALERRLSGCGAWAWLLRGMWDLSEPGLDPVSPALAGGFLTTAPPGKSPHSILLVSSVQNTVQYFYINSV